MAAAELGWPIERLTSLLAGGFTLLTLALARIHHPRWRILSGLIGANLVAQAVTGWCPASLLMRKLGMRTAAQKALDARPSGNR